MTEKKKRFCLSFKMATNFFWIGYHFDEFRSQVAIRKKKLISHPVKFILIGNIWWFTVSKALLRSKDKETT